VLALAEPLAQLPDRQLAPPEQVERIDVSGAIG
jgi:hypothetical protein